MFWEDGGNPRVLLIPVETKESTTVRPLSRVDEEKSVVVPEQPEVVTPPPPPPFVGPAKPEVVIRPQEPVENTKKVTVVPHKDTTKAGSHNNGVVAPLAVGIVILSWWLVNLMKRRKAVVPVAPKVEEPVVPAEVIDPPHEEEPPPVVPEVEEPTPVEVVDPPHEEPVVTPIVGPCKRPEQETIVIVRATKRCCDTLPAIRRRSFEDNAYSRAGQSFKVQGYNSQIHCDDGVFTKQLVALVDSYSTPEPK